MVVESVLSTLLALDIIRTDGGTQPRAELNQSHIEELAELIREGRIFKDPVTIFYDGTHYWLADGFHRVNAAKLAGLSSIDADIRQGTQEDAIVFSCGANSTHGLRRTKGDIRRAIKRLIELPKWKSAKQKDIAKKCNASESFVSEVLRELRNEDSNMNPPEKRDEAVEGVRLAALWEEKRRRVEQFFVDYPTLWHLSNREIAKRCQVDEKLVRTIRKELQEKQQEEEKEQPGDEITEITTLEFESSQDNATTLEVASQVDDIQMEQEESSDDEIPITPEPESEPTGDIQPEQIDSHTAVEETVPTILDTLPIIPSPATPEPEKTKFEPVVTSEEKPQEKPPTTNSQDTEREAKREQLKERITQLKERGVDLPSGRYSCLVVDPPWAMQKIEREERPNQFEFDYPTMNEQELKSFPLPTMAADDCHLYLWTTQKHLPLALCLAEHWGFKYQCLMTWVKNVGFTPYSWMYSTEHVLFCTKGNLPLLEKGRRLDFGGKVREHSRKPDEFYDIVRDVSPGPRLDVFSREKRSGFDQYGNEADKFVQV